MNKGLLLQRIASYDPEAAELLARFALAEITFDWARMRAMLEDIVAEAFVAIKVAKAA